MNEELLEKIDSLWFFSSVLSPSSQLLTQNPQISTQTNEYIHAQKQDQEKTKEDCNCNCIEIAGVVVEKRRGKRKGRSSKNRVQKWIQQRSAGTQWEERTPFAVLYDCQMRNSRRNEQTGIHSKFTNDLEMKQQLRSWAYAVACSLRVMRGL